MKYQFCIHVDGPGFDPEHFNDALDLAAKGVVRAVRQVKPDKARRPLTYWQSRVVQIASDSPNEPVQELVNLLRSELLKVKKLPEVRILASFAGYYDDIESMNGFFLSAETIGLLAGVGASMDIDLVPSAKLIKSAAPPE